MLYLAVKGGHVDDEHGQFNFMTLTTMDRKKYYSLIKLKQRITLLSLDQ